MSLKTSYNKNYGPTRRSFDQDLSFSPFEVIDMGDKKVGINEGVVIFGSTSVSYSNIEFTSGPKPQDLLGGDIDEGKLLTVKKDDFVIILLTDNSSTRPKAEIKAVPPAELDKEEYKRKKNKVIKLARIRDSKDIEGATYLDIENLYASQVISETENWPAFSPVMWPVEKIADGNADGPQTPSTWKAVFIPGSLYLPQTMDECKVFEIEGKSMLDLPIIEVKKGDKWYVTYEIDKEWKVKNKPKFTKTPDDKKIVKVVPEGPECESTSGSDSPCTPKDGFFKLKILEFEDKNGGLGVKQYWKSDIAIYGWERCPPQCDEDDDSSDGTDSDSDDDDSSDDIPDSDSSDIDEDSNSSDSDSSDSSSSTSSSACCPSPSFITLQFIGVGGYGGGSICPPESANTCFNSGEMSGGGTQTTYVVASAELGDSGGVDGNACDKCGTEFILAITVEGGGTKKSSFIAPGDNFSSCFVCTHAPCTTYCAHATVQQWGSEQLGSKCKTSFDAFCPAKVTQCFKTPGLCADNGGCATTPNPPGE